MKMGTKYCLSAAIGVLLFPLLMLTISSHTARGQDKLTARQIMEKVAENRQLQGSEGVITIVIYNAKGQKRIRKLAMITKLYDSGNTEKKMSRFLEPADVKGTGLLTFDYEKKDDDIWLFMPALRKTRRIVSSEKSKSFMGSEFSYWDMNIPNLDDFRYRIIKEEKVESVDCWVIESIAKNEDIADEAGYKKQEMWVGKLDFVVRKGLYYDLDGGLFKELNAKKVKLIDSQQKRYRAMFMEMINRQSNRRSTISIDKIEINRNVKDDYFTTRYLERF